MSMKPIPSCRVLVSAVAAASLGLAGCATASSEANWVAYDGDKAGSKFSKAPLVTKDSVENMEVAWEWSMPDNQVWKDNPDLITWMNQSTPLAIDGVLYSSSPMSFVSAIDGAMAENLRCS